MFTGWKTVVLAVGSFLVYSLGWEDLQQYVSSQHIAQISAGIMLVMRLVSDGPAALKTWAKSKSA